MSSRKDLDPQTLPCSADIEKAVLCALLRSPEKVSKLCSSKLSVKAFYIPAHQLIYDLILELIDKRKPINFVSLKQILIDRRQLAEIGDTEYLSSLVDFVPTAEGAEYNVETLLEKQQRRDAILAFRDASLRCFDQGEDIESILADAESGLLDLRKFSRADRGDEVFAVEDLLNFDREHDALEVLGNRWLCKGDSLLISGPTGIGKSSFAMQGAISWALGKHFFGIKTSAPQKVLIIQSENNLGDLAVSFQDICDRLALGKADIDQLARKLVFIRESSKTGNEFLGMAKRLLAEHKPDIILVDPLLSFLGGDINRQEVVSEFLRNGIQPILNETGIIWIFVHHTGKPPKDQTAKPAGSNGYSALGSSELVNWPREVLTFIPRDWEKRVFDLEFRKRAKQSGITSPEGNPVYELTIRHSPHGVVWEPCTRDEINESEPSTGKGRPAKYSVDQLLAVLGEQSLTHTQFKEAAMKATRMGKTKFGELLKAGIDSGKIELLGCFYKIKVS
jgi:replicative DNA helicase